jgi:hypothetical protein
MSVAAESLRLSVRRAISAVAKKLCASTDRGSSANARSNMLIASVRLSRDGGFKFAARPRRM